MKGIVIEKCVKTGKKVLVKDCEECQTKRKCLPICFKRGFVWGRPDNLSPLWALTQEEAKKSKEDISIYYAENDENAITVIINKKETILNNLRWEIWERDNFTCKICGIRRNLSIDHIKPESKNGTLDKNNLQTLCRSCNSKKGCKYE